MLHGAAAVVPPTSRLAADRNRFLTFALAAAELLVEVTSDGRIGFTAGAFQSRLGTPPEAWTGRRVRELVALADRGEFDLAFSLLLARDRLAPMAFRLNDPAATPVSIGGLRLLGDGGADRFCLSIAVSPNTLPQPGLADAAALRRAAEAELGGGEAPCLGLIEIHADGEAAEAAALIRDRLAESLPAGSRAGELGTGRYGVLGAGPGDLGLLSQQIEALLQGAGHAASVATGSLPLETAGLTPLQATRALRYALSAFDRGGVAAVEDAGAEGGLGNLLGAACARAAGLRQAIEEHRFALSFQPIVALETGEVQHYEALLRPDPTAPEAPQNPQEFVLLAEAIGLSEELDWAVLRSVCAAARGSRGGPIAANISGLSLQSPTFRDRLLALLEAEPALVHRLLIEITETAEIEDEAEATRSVAALRDLGLPLCIDDFGAGAASFRYLRLLRVDYVKIDGTYVTRAARHAKDRAILAAMVDLAHGMRAEVVAEHIETEEEAALMRELGVEYGQGWLFGRPGPLPRGR
ncbi:EAL domain-containing protein [Belnapia sp. T6]|uniref:EAL domain-containing protein n=1 Tax=Belnapia mucosa TaxID=2804532 RepID=A0ABS1V2U6_9PROT|nr:EAL domain-containing protein [Belnapia mucosa]MBL6456018.1 EAL domain-containing protein [Belnapia mucosa]